MPKGYKPTASCLSYPLQTKVRKKDGTRIARAARAEGESVAEFVRTAILERLERLNGTAKAKSRARKE